MTLGLHKSADDHSAKADRGGVEAATFALLLRTD